MEWSEIMDERDWADRFTCDVDGLLMEAGRMDPEPLPAEYRQALEMARALATIDFSVESRVRHALRSRLIDRAGARGGEKKGSPAPAFRPRRRGWRRLLMAVGGALALLLAMVFLYPGGPAVAAQSIGNGVKLVVLGAYSTARQVEAFVTGRPPPDLDDGWHVSMFVGHRAGGNAPPGTYPTVESVASFEEAQRHIAFPLRAPDYLPPGYILSEIKLAPVLTGPGTLLFSSNPNAFLFYEGPGPDVVIVQQSVGPQPGGDPNIVVGQAVGLITDGTLVEVDLNGRTAVWADDCLLLWEEDGVSYEVGGLGLSLDEAVRVAESLE
jgi:hypothetical protein